ncbi:MAG: LacI family DNA-binding transcriptional regulator [Alphaproteobacteria bacterium]|nr:LacI family DNA-binding transcriptional regulator [Alphaproteobacteria bacterium]
MSDYRKITLSDVATRVGVSAITVSRALRSPEKVSVVVREKIFAAVEDLGYVPDAAARALASSRTNVIGVLIPSVTNNVFSDVLKGIYTGIENTPFDLQLGNTRYSVLSEEQLLRVFLSQRSAGLVVTGTDQSGAARALLASAPCPVVQIMETDNEPVDMVVGFSHYQAGQAATEHLLAQGYKKPAFIGARMDPRTQRRFRAFADTAKKAGAFDPARVATTPAPSTVTLGGQLFGDLLATAPDTDAVFCNNDDIALGVMFEAQRRRISIPESLGICGFNDLEMMAVAEPPITSVRTPRFEMGQRAIAMLIEAIGGTPPARPLVDIGFQLLRRRSTGC